MPSWQINRSHWKLKSLKYAQCSCFFAEKLPIRRRSTWKATSTSAESLPMAAFFIWDFLITAFKCRSLIKILTWKGGVGDSISINNLLCYVSRIGKILCVATVSVRFLLLIILKWFPTYKLWCDLRRLKTCVHSFINCSKNLNLIKTIQSLEKLMT